jgi:hypothetical protein
MSQLYRIGALVALLSLSLPAQAQQATRCAFLGQSGDGLSGEPLSAAQEAVREAMREGGYEVVEDLALTRALREAGASHCDEDECVPVFLQVSGAQIAVALTVHAAAGSSTPFRVSITLTDADGRQVNAEATIDSGNVSQACELATHDAVARWGDRDGIPFRITGSPAGANVSIDGRVIGQLPEVVATLSTGPHMLAVGREGYLTYTRRIEVGGAGGDSLEVSLRPRPGTDPDAALSADANDPSPWTTRRLVGVGLAGAGTLATAGLLIAGAVGTKCVEENEAGCLVSREPSGAHWALVGLSAAVAATGFVLWILPPGDTPAEDSTAVGLTPTGVELRYTF